MGTSGVLRWINYCSVLFWIVNHGVLFSLVVTDKKINIRRCGLRQIVKRLRNSSLG